jgi:hypothetical protein
MPPLPPALRKASRPRESSKSAARARCWFTLPRDASVVLVGPDQPLYLTTSGSATTICSQSSQGEGWPAAPNKSSPPAICTSSGIQLPAAIRDRPTRSWRRAAGGDIPAPESSLPGCTILDSDSRPTTLDQDWVRVCGYLASNSVREQGPLSVRVPVGRLFHGGYHGTPNIS